MESRKSGWAHAGAGALIAAAAFAAFLPALECGWTNFDDNANFLENPHYRGLGWDNLAWMFTHGEGHYIPLTWLTLGADYLLWGMDARGYHLTNLLLHALTAVLFYVFLLGLLSRGRGGPGPTVRLASLAGALLFTLHPMRVESVAWVTERRDVLSGLFFMLTLIAYLCMCRAGRGTPAWRKWYAFSIAFFLCSLLSKTTGMMLPFVLLILDACPLGRLREKGILAEKIPYLVLLAGAVIVTAVTQANVGTLRGMEEYGMADRLMQPGYRFSFYLWKALLPIGLSPLYLNRPVESYVALKYILPLVAVVGATVAFFLLRRRAPWALAAWLAYAALIAPVAGFFQAGPHFAADRYTYLSMLPFAALAAAGVLEAWKRAGGLRVAVPAGAIVTLACLGVMTHAQTRIWKGSLELWNYVLTVDPDNYIAHNNRGLARQAAGDPDGAYSDYCRAIELKPDCAIAYMNRGAFYARIGLLDQAIRDHDAAIRHKQDFARAHDNRGMLRMRKSDLDGAIADFNKSIGIDAGNFKAFHQRGKAFWMKDDLDAALADFTEAIRLRPGNPDSHFMRAVVLEQRRDVFGAVSDYSRALQFAPPDWPQRAAVEEKLKVLGR